MPRKSVNRCATGRHRRLPVAAATTTAQKVAAASVKSAVKGIAVKTLAAGAHLTEKGPNQGAATSVVVQQTGAAAGATISTIRSRAPAHLPHAGAVAAAGATSIAHSGMDQSAERSSEAHLASTSGHSISHHVLDSCKVSCQKKCLRSLLCGARAFV